MRPPIASACSLLACILLAGCASRRLPDYEKPLARTPVQNVRTTAYTHTESDHIKHGRKNACGTTLRCGAVNSAAADWSRWPVGTVFRLAETGEIFQVDDYGWALSGTNTIDLYKPSRSAMNAWGVRRVTIEIVQWGDVWRSRAILDPRSDHKHVKRMLKQIDDRYDRDAQIAAPTVAPQPAAPAQPPSRPGMVRKPFYTTAR